MRKSQRGFTLIELLIVIAVLGVLAAVAVPNVSGFLIAGKVQAANTEAANVETAAMAYYGSTGAMPTTTDDLNSDYLAGLLGAKYTFDANGKVASAADTPTEATTQYKAKADDWLTAGLVYDTKWHR